MVIRVVGLSHGRVGTIVLWRLADLHVLRHPGLVTAWEVVSLPERWAGVIMNLVDGAGLDVVLGVRGRLNVSLLAALLDTLGSALVYLHEYGATHGDVPSGNVLVATDGHPVLVNLLDSVMETGTQEHAAPERLAGAPSSATGDVHALVRLLTECSGQGDIASRYLAGILTDALAEEPTDRLTARDLAARAPQLGRASPIEPPDGARMAAGSLRAAVRTPTHAVDSGLRPKARLSRQPRTRSESWNNHGSAGRTGRGSATMRWGGRGESGRSRTRAWGLTAVALVAICLAVWGLAKALVSHRPVRAPRAAVGPTASARPLTSSRVGAISSGSPSPLVAGSSVATASMQASGGSGGVDVVSVVIGLSAARDRALMAGGTVALAATTVLGSPAAWADTQVLAELSDSGEGIRELHTSVSQVAEAGLPDDAAEQWAGVRVVRVMLSQSASTRSGPEGTRTVPAFTSRQVVLIVVPGPWRVADIRAVE